MIVVINGWLFTLSSTGTDVVICSQVSACSGEMEPYKDHQLRSDYLCTSDKAQKETSKTSLHNFHHQHLPELKKICGVK